MNKYLSKFVQSDFLIANAKYMESNFTSADDSVSETFINAVSKQKDFKNGGRIYYGWGKLLSKKFKGNLQLYGMEDFLHIVEGKFDLEKFKTGKYIIEGLKSDDNGNIYWQYSNMKIGEKVKVNTGGAFHEYEVMAKCRIQNGNYNRIFA